MKTKSLNSIKDFSTKDGPLVDLSKVELMKLPHPYEDWQDPPLKEMTDDQKDRIEHSLDGIMGIGIPKPQ